MFLYIPQVLLGFAMLSCGFAMCSYVSLTFSYVFARFCYVFPGFCSVFAGICYSLVYKQFLGSRETLHGLFLDGFDLIFCQCSINFPGEFSARNPKLLRSDPIIYY